MNPVVLERARMLVELDRDAEARTLLTSLLADDPDEPQALCLLAQACLGVGDSQAALTAASGAARLAPEDEWARRLAALALVRLKRPLEARAQADAAIRLAPDEWRTHVNRAQIDVIAKQVSDVSVAAAQHAVRLAPFEADTHRVLGAALLGMNRVPEAEGALREALRLNPQDYAARNDLARLDLRRRRLGEAARGFADAAALEPGDEVAAANLLVVGARALRRVHLLLWLVLFTAGRYAVGTHEHRRSVLGVGWLIVIGALAVFARDVHGGSGRRALALGRVVLRRDRLLAAWAGCLALAMLALTAAVLAPLPVLAPAVGVAAFGLFVGVVLTWVRSVRLRRRARR